MTPDKRKIIQEHASKQNESATTFINRAIDEAMEHDKKRKSLTIKKLAPKMKLVIPKNKNNT